MLEITIKIDGKEYTRKEAEKLYEELRVFLDKPDVVIERIIERRDYHAEYNPWVCPPRIQPRFELPNGTSTPWLPRVICYAGN